MASAIIRSLEAIPFAVDILKDRIAMGSFESPEYYSQTGTLCRVKDRKDRGIRRSFKKHGRKAPPIE